MAKLYDLARMTTATTGTGTITLGSAVTGYLSFANAGISNGDVIDYAINDPGSSATASEIGTGTYTSSGTTLTRNVARSTNSNTAINLSGNAHVFISPRAESLPLPRSYLAGLTLSTAGSSNTFGIAIGQCTDSTNLQSMTLASAYTKTTGAWTVGTGNGSLDTGAVATATWYHVHLIYRPDTGIVDVLTSLSATSPTMPTNYTLARRIGAMLTDGSAHWSAFTQIGDVFLWTTAVTDLAGVTLTSSAVLKTLTVPTGVKVTAFVSGYATHASNLNVLYINSPDQGTGQIMPMALSNSGQYSAYNSSVLTNTSAQVYASSNNATGSTTELETGGWADRRGRDT